MSRSFSQLKKSKNVEALQQQVEKTLNPTNKYEDERFWKPTTDKAGKGTATIRFLPPSPDEDMRWVQVFKHFFKGSGNKYYVENSLTTINKDDPVSEMNSFLWDNGDKDVVSKYRKRRMKYISNIYVVDDPANPDNNGKVFLFEYGKKIFDKLNEMICPEDEDDVAVDPFDFWEGANFKLIVKRVDRFPNYDASKFLKPKQLLSDDKEMEALWNSQTPLSEFVNPESDHFKTYEELKQKLISVLGEEAIDFFSNKTNNSVGESVEAELDDDEDDADMDSSDSELEESVDDVSLDEDDGEAPFDLDDDEDDLESFQDLV